VLKRRLEPKWGGGSNWRHEKRTEESMGLSHAVNEDIQHPTNVKSKSAEIDVLLITLYDLRSVLM
jgi:hypothetical protein